MVSKLDNTKWDVSNWTVEMKIDWQKEMFNLGYTWKNHTLCEVIHLGAYYYFVGEDGEITYYMGRYFEEAPHTPLTWEDVFSEKKTNPSIFDNPKWVTCCNDSLGRVTLGKDYKVVNVNNNNYTIIMDTGVEGSLHKDRFYKVTYEDLLPEKVATEDKEESFEDLVIDYCVLNYRNYIVKSKFSEEQLRFMQKVLPPYSYMTVSDTFEIARLPFHEANELSFNDIFKHKSEV